MPLQSRLRAPQGVVAGTADAANRTPQHQHHHHHHPPLPQPPHYQPTPCHKPYSTPPTLHHAPRSPETIHINPAGGGVVKSSSGNAGVQEEIEGQPARKRRKLSIRTTGHTLESFGFGAQQPRPPTKIIHHEPNEAPQRTLNTVTNALDIDEDELLQPGPKPERVSRKPTKSPAPIPTPTQQNSRQEDKRALRSQDEGPRLKSELAVYFPNYEDVIFDAPQEGDEFINVDTVLYITDDTAKKKDEPSPAKSGKLAAPRKSSSDNCSPAAPRRTSSNPFSASPIVTLDFLSTTIGDDPEDPLTDEHFLKSHRRAERKEKQLRNIERERAMHEKSQLERLLDGLQGHDWLRVLGISGVTDGEARKYEPKRDYFTAEVQALINKFAQWKDQEKKLRLRKEAVQAAREAEEEGEEGTDGATEDSIEPPSSDLNASAAQQLQQETANSITLSSRASAARGKERAHNNTSHPSTPTLVPSSSRPLPYSLVSLSPELPITSFYAKRHLRDAALSKTRHGRNVTAFGQPVPDMEEREFVLPVEYVTEDALRSNARERRRRKRESMAKSQGK